MNRVDGEIRNKSLANTFLSLVVIIAFCVLLVTVTSAVTLEELPEAVRSTIEKYARGGKVTEIEIGKDDGQSIYEVEVIRDQEEFECKISLAGVLLEGEMPLGFVTKAARDTIEKFVKDGSINKIELERDDDEVIYEVEVTKKGKEFDIEVSSTGVLLKEEMFLDTVPEAVRKTIVKFAEGGNISKIELDVDPDEDEIKYEVEVEKGGKEYEIEISPTGELLDVEQQGQQQYDDIDYSTLPLGLTTLKPDFVVTGKGKTVDTIAFWEATNPNETLMFVTAKSNSLVEVWKYPFVDNELAPLIHSSFTNSRVNGVAVDQEAGLLYVAVGEPSSTVSVFELPSLKFKFQFIEGKVDLGGEPNICLLKHANGQTWLYVTGEETIYILNAKTGQEIGRIKPPMEVETVFADDFHQIIYVPDEHKKSGIHAYTPEGKPLLKNKTNRFGGNGIVQRDAEGVWIYTFKGKDNKDRGRGFIILSDQRKDVTDFEFFDRQSWKHLGTLRLEGIDTTDGIASIQKPMKNYPLGLFVAIDNDVSTAGIGWDKVFKAMGVSVEFSCSAVKIPKQIGKWRVEVGPAGNEFYQPPQKKAEVKPPSEAVLRYARIFVPHIKVTEWELDDDEYEIRCERGDEEYRFDITPKGELTELQYENDETDINEEADELVLRGTKKSIAVTAVPKRTLATLAEAYPRLKPSKAWTAETIAGPRFVIQIGPMAFYARPDGQIRAGRRIDDGGLDEIDPPGKKKDKKAFKAELERLLGQYRERFNFQNQIKKLGKNPRSPDGSYRYVVMGDNRSNWDLWSNMVKHIDGLEPKPAFVINSGDIVPKGYARELHEYYIPPLLKTDIPFFVAIGNHETGDDDMAREFRYLFGGKKSLNYYFDYGKARYVFFDNASDASSPEKTLKWLDKTLADTPKGYRKYVTMHKPPTTIKKWAYHAWDDDESKVFTELMTKHKVAEVYLGHIHAYSTAKHDGVNYTISGGGGAGLHNRYGPKGNVHHYVICDVSADGTVKQQVVRFYDTSKESK